MKDLLDKRSVLRSLGMFGFVAQEPIILSALIADLPILFYGPHGQMKTLGAEVISKSLLGKDSIFKPYDTSRVSLQELLGVISPHSLKDNELRYIPSPHTVWGADAILMDEFTMATPILGSIIHELVLSKTVMGMRTNVKLAFASCNPPSDYESHYMNLATCSRFIIVSIPEPKDLSEDLDNILSLNNKFDYNNRILSLVVKEGRKTILSEEDSTKIRILVKRISRCIDSFKNIRYSTRQSVYLNKMIKSFERLKLLGYNATDSDLVNLILSTVPECSKLVATMSNSADLSAIKVEIAKIVAGFAIGDPLVTTNISIIDLLKIETTDFEGWCGALIACSKKADKKDLRGGIQYLKTKKDKFEKRPHVFNLIFHKLLEAYLKKTPGPKSVRNKVVSTKSLVRLIEKL